MPGVYLAKTIADLTFGGAFFWYLIKALVSAAAAYCAILLGTRWRKSKNAKTEVETKTEVSA